MSPGQLREAIGAAPRVRFATLPTALEDYPLVAEAAGLPRLLVKRDDQAGLAFGGSKVRIFEFVLGQALSRGADVLVTGGGAAQSNHARVCAAAARRAGIDSVVLLRGPRPDSVTGNLLITELIGADIHWMATDPTMLDRYALVAGLRRITAELARAGRTPFLLESSVHPAGVLGYLDEAAELAEQLDALGIDRATVVIPSLGAGVVGLTWGAQLLGRDWDVHGLAWSTIPEDLDARLRQLATDAIALVDLDVPANPGSVSILGDTTSPYAVPSPATWAAMELAAMRGGLLLDPVYTGRGFAGMLAEYRSGRLARERPIVFVHTGGLPALFARDELSDGRWPAANTAASGTAA
jgi:1-aminocyclopropane-1-carboxylate deaminase